MIESRREERDKAVFSEVESEVIHSSTPEIKAVVEDSSQVARA